MKFGFGIIGIPKRGGGPLVKPSPSARIDPQHWAAQGLVGCWLMDSIASVHNRADNTRVGWVNAPSQSANHLTFDGVNDHAIIGSAAKFLPDAWSVTARMACTPAASNIVIAAFNSNAFDAGVGKLYYYFNGTRPLLYVGPSGGFRYFEPSTPTNLYDGAMRGITFTLPGTAAADIGNSAMYAAGRQQTVHSSNTGADSSAKNEFIIGSRRANFTLEGNVEHLMLHNRALNPSEIAELHAEPYSMFWLPGSRRIFLPVETGGQIISTRRIKRYGMFFSS